MRTRSHFSAYVFYRWIPVVATLLGAGCATQGVRFSDVNVPPLPSVLAFSNGNFPLNAQVFNGTNNAVKGGELTLDVRAWYNTLYAKELCKKDFSVLNNHMAPDATWNIKEFDFDESAKNPGDPCRCSTGTDCRGVVWIRLLRTGSWQQLDGPRTYLGIGFKKPGTLAEMTVHDLSD
jgi:hypothetical protein